MKQVWAVMMAFAAAFAMAAAPKVMVRTGAFKEGPVEVRWSAAYPVAIEGWSLADLEALWKRIDGLCFASEQGAPSDLLLRTAHKLMAAKEAEGISEQALTSINTLQVPFANKDWVGIALDVYDNEGGSGCHAEGRLVVLSRQTQEAMEADWFADDVGSLRRLVVQHLEQALIKKDKEGKSPFVGEGFTKSKAEEVWPDFLPAPEGICFRYDAYEILPGGFGMPEVTVPWKALESVCKPERLAQLKALVTP